ncbi:Serine/threonine-protein kinase plk1 [Dermatophagoides farinae]|uniref:Serine/threonine-protein kinase PLK n=1 Tax=Dermatophagoides farinae TaxID=6954 RepID=A0A922KYN3_DERFA|nr:Serine/threonine-protein kinase plk1 [Dermatophagoides farinae]
MTDKLVSKIDIPDLIINPQTKKQYQKGKFLGRGGFAKCYEFTDLSTKKMYACKVISKTQLVKDKHKTKMSLEISIHRSVDHEHIVKFYSFFEDANFVYIILELCGKRSLMEMHKRRKRVSEAELRYYVRQITLACVYLHNSRIVHRDLKLGNLFLNDDMQVKLGDFGLATKLNQGEQRKTLCGTPNYIAPEILLETGHGFEVDVWSLGCIVFTLAVGKPPFETEELKNTYRKIKKNDYTIPNDVNPALATFIHKMLQADPSKRPTMQQILKDPYLIDNYIPSCLPTSCLSVAPRINENRLSILAHGEGFRRPFSEMANQEKDGQSAKETNNGQAKAAANNQLAANKGVNALLQPLNENAPSDYYLSELREQVIKLMSSKRLRVKQSSNDDEAEHPASMPCYWVSKWVDYTDRYGIGYQLCDNSIGVLFNDSTKFILMPDQTNFHYIDKDGVEEYYKYNPDYAPDHLVKKTTLFRYFRNYMNSHLIKMGEKQKQQLGEKEEMVRVPYINSWFRTNSAIVFHLTNGTVQLNFFKDHIKLILCPHMAAVTFVNETGDFRAYKFSLLEEHGINSELLTRLKYAKEVLSHLHKKIIAG